ncbi:MAG: hypothetical protein IJD42_05400 [Clostridia bacterium]|nr:hypothetical protein [Clostridia bacterium]
MEIKAKYEYDGITHVEFEFNGKKAIVLLPASNKKNGKAILKTEYFGAFPELQLEMVKRGYTLLFIENHNRWGTPEQIEDQYEFILFASKEFDISSKVITIGMSCGGMISIHLAARHPEVIDTLYLDAPVLNYLSCPARFGDACDVTDGMWDEFERAWHMTKSELLTFRGHPIDELGVLIENKIRVYMAYGDSDKTVPYHENGIVLERAYMENGLENILFIDKKEGVDHHPHGPSDINCAINFIEGK